MSEEKRRTYTILLSVLLVLTVCFIWGNSLLNWENSAQLSRGLLDFLKPLLEFLGLPADDDHWLRKLTHFTEFGALGAELCMLFSLHRPFRPKLIPYSAAVALPVAVIDETIQAFSGRFSAASDVLLDFSGALTGIAVLYLIIHIVKRRKSG